MADVEMVIFKRTFDFLAWVLPATNTSHALTATPSRSACSTPPSTREWLEEADLRKGQARLERLRQADEALACVRMYLRLAAHFKWLSPGQYYHAASMLVEVGKLLGGWQKATA